VGRYENIVVLSPDLAKEEEDDLMKRIQGNLEKAGAATIKPVSYTHLSPARVLKRIM